MKLGDLKVIFTDVIMILFAALIVILFIKYSKKESNRHSNYEITIDSMFSIIRHQDSMYTLASREKDTITILRERIITTPETNRIIELKREIALLKKQSSHIPVSKPIKPVDPIELYVYFDNIINPPPDN